MDLREWIRKHGADYNISSEAFLRQRLNRTKVKGKTYEPPPGFEFYKIGRQWFVRPSGEAPGQQGETLGADPSWQPYDGKTYRGAKIPNDIIAAIEEACKDAIAARQERNIVLEISPLGEISVRDILDPVFDQFGEEIPLYKSPLVIVGHEGIRSLQQAKELLFMELLWATVFYKTKGERQRRINHAIETFFPWERDPSGNLVIPQHLQGAEAWIRTRCANCGKDKKDKKADAWFCDRACGDQFSKWASKIRKVDKAMQEKAISKKWHQLRLSILS